MIVVARGTPRSLSSIGDKALCCGRLILQKHLVVRACRPRPWRVPIAANMAAMKVAVILPCHDRHDFWWPLVDANHKPMWPLVGIVVFLPALIFTLGKADFYDPLREEARKLGAGVAQPWFGIIGPRIGLELVAALEGRDYEEAKRVAAEAMEAVTQAAEVTAWRRGDGAEHYAHCQKTAAQQQAYARQVALQQMAAEQAARAAAAAAAT